MNMYSEIWEACEKEHEVATTVFPNSALVINMFIQRIFKKHVLFSFSFFFVVFSLLTMPSFRCQIQVYVTSFLSRDVREGGVSLPQYLDRLVYSQQSTAALIQKLEKYNTDGLLDLAIWMDDIFIPFVRNEVYIEDEKIQLVQYFGAELAEFASYKQKRKSQKGLFKKAEADTIESRLSRAVGSVDLAGPGDSKFSNVSVELALNFIHAQEDAVKRVQKLSSSAHLPGNVAVLDETLLHHLGREYLTPFLEL